MSNRWWHRWLGKAATPSAPSQPPVPEEQPPLPPATLDTGGLPFGVRPVTARDDAALDAFISQHLPTCDPQHWQQGQRVLAHWQGTLCGYARLGADGSLTVFVSEDMRQLGIGTLLFQHLEDDGRALGLKQLYASADQNGAAFLRTLGFTLTDNGPLATKVLCP